MSNATNKSLKKKLVKITGYTTSCRNRLVPSGRHGPNGPSVQLHVEVVQQREYVLATTAKLVMLVVLVIVLNKQPAAQLHVVSKTVKLLTQHSLSSNNNVNVK